MIEENHSESFEIRVRKWGSNAVYKMQVDHYYKSDRMLKFRVKGGEKTLELRRQLVGKTWKWKIGRHSFEFDSNDKVNALLILSIGEAIEDHIKGDDGRPQPNLKWKTK
jgi:hypothetical protein